MRKFSPVLILLVLVAACGSDADVGSDLPAADATGVATAASPVLADSDQTDTSVIGKFLTLAFTEEGFTEDEAGCLSGRFVSDFGEEALEDMMLADQEPPGFEDAMGAFVLDCLSAERILDLGEEAEEQSVMSDAYAYLSCSDPVDDIRSEYSGWTPSIPWGMGDVADLDLALENGALSVTLRMQGQPHPLTGGPGDTPLIARMYLVSDDESGPVAYDVELMRLSNEDDPPGPILVTTVDGQTGDFVSSQVFEDVMTGPSIMTATIPVTAVDQVVANDFWVEVRTEWGPDHPIGSNADLEWMIDSACDGPQYVEVSGSGAVVAAMPPGQPWSPKTVDQLIDPVFLVDEGFGFGIPPGWYEEVWMKAADGGGEVTSGEGVRFTGLGGSTRAGIMVDVNADVSSYSHVVVAIHGAVLDQSLSGTGWYGREAPLALAVRYVDEAGTEHVGLSEDPAAPTNMFFVGFTALPEAGMINGAAVTLGEPFVYQVDLMELDPAPAQILSVVVEGGGWDPRIGEVYEVMLAGGS